MKTAVSIIIPIYNVEKYLPRCLESVINQTLKNIEIILVDDGSPDNCSKICDDYKEKDERIKVIHKRNEGLGYARNSGLAIASGEYVAFVDSDDFIESNMYEELYDYAKKTKADTCLCGYKKIDNDGNIEYFPNPLGNNVYEKDEVINKVLLEMLGTKPGYKDDTSIGMSVWKGIYSNKIILENNIEFCSERQFCSEDIIFDIDYFIKSKKVALLSEPLYFYFKNNSSLTTAYKGNRFVKMKILYLELIRKCNEVGILDKAYERIYRTFIGRARACIVEEIIKNKDKDDSRNNIKEILKDRELENVLRNYPIKKLPPKQMIFAYLAKHKQINLIKVLVYARYK